MSSTENAIHARGLAKSYVDPKRGRVEALRGLDLDCRPGEIYGLLGPNGAGKTTTLRILATILAPTAGTATVAGVDVTADPLEARRRIGFLSGTTGLYPRLTPRETLRYFGTLHGIEKDRLEARIAELLETFSITEYADGRCEALSTGQKQKVSIARAVLHDPAVLILDEPTTGLDILASSAMIEFIDAARARGTCVLFSTHVLSEAERLCDRIGIIHRGTLLASGTLDELARATGKEWLEDIFLALDREARERSGSESVTESEPTTGRRMKPRRRPPLERPAPVARDQANTLSTDVAERTAVWAIFKSEVLGLLRDRRALFSAFILPTLLYPFLFLGNAWLAKFSKDVLDARHVRVAIDTSALPSADGNRLRELIALEAPIEIVEVDAAMLLALETTLESGATVTTAERTHVERILEKRADLLLVARRLGFAPHLALRTYYDGQTDIGNEAEKRARKAITTLRTELQAVRLQTVLGGDPARGLDAQAIDVATEKAASGAKLGQFLPLVLVFVLLAGASYAALAAFAGERESGTLETLLVQPVRARSIVSAKFLAVLATGVVALVLNAGSVLVSLNLGLGSLPGTGLENGLILDGARLLLAGILFLPAVVFLCAVLCLVCGRARTFREGQQVLLPLLFLSIVPVLPATQGDVSLDALLAAVPLCGPALALRDALRGQFSPLLMAWMFVAQAAWAWLALSRLATLLDAERVVQGPENAAETEARNTQSRVATRWAVVAVFAVYLIGATLQKWNIVWGLAATLWLLLLPLGLLSARGTARRAKESLSQALWLAPPRIAHALGALTLAPALALAAAQLFEWQQRVLPMPTSQGEVTLFPGAPGDHTWALLALVALSPAICEELFFRGALLSGLRRDLPAWRVIAVQMLFFGAVHMSIYRFLPTAILGGVLALLTLRAKSLWPAVILHASYNGLLVLEQEGVFETRPVFALAALLGVVAFALVPGRGHGKNQPILASDR